MPVVIDHYRLHNRFHHWTINKQKMPEAPAYAEEDQIPLEKKLESLLGAHPDVKVGDIGFPRNRELREAAGALGMPLEQLYEAVADRNRYFETASDYYRPGEYDHSEGVEEINAPTDVSEDFLTMDYSDFQKKMMALMDQGPGPNFVVKVDFDRLERSTGSGGGTSQENAVPAHRLKAAAELRVDGRRVIPVLVATAYQYYGQFGSIRDLGNAMGSGVKWERKRAK